MAICSPDALPSSLARPLPTDIVSGEVGDFKKRRKIRKSTQTFRGLAAILLLVASSCHGFMLPTARTKVQTALYVLKSQNVTVLHSNEDDEFTQLSASAAASDNVASTAGALVPTTNVVLESSYTNAHNSKRRGFDLMWCSGEYCKESIRERVVGEDNKLVFDGPATGQVCFMWNDEDQCLVDKEGAAVVEAAAVIEAATASVLFLVKQNDEGLLQTAANAIRELTDYGVNVFLEPDMAAMIEYKYGVRNDNVKLFEPRTSPGFGGNHVPIDDKWMAEFSQYDAFSDDEELWCPVDLICTLGGDGLLMHANVMFQGAVPPILCVAGGSLGFLTPFSRDEMVEAIRVSLGMVRGSGEMPEHLCADRDPVAIKPYDVLRQNDHYFNGGDHNSSEGSYSGDAVPKFSFGLGNRICLSMRMRLECKVINREGVVRARFNVLNEVTVDRGSSPYLAALECFCDNVHLTTVQADGVIFATPTGSTAYSMAAGGSVVHPAVPAILVTPICPHVLSFRSMIFPDSVVLRCYVPDDARADASVAFDGRYRRVLHRGDSVQIQMSQHPVPTINRVDHSADWLCSLKRNFNFNTRARQRPL
jgi:NAD+ kinase